MLLHFTVITINIFIRIIYSFNNSIIKLMITSINSYKVNKFIITADYVCTDFSSNLFLLTKNHQP